MKLRDQVRLIQTADGDNILVIDGVVPDDAPTLVREGFARRSIVNGGHPCPCGAVPVWPNRAQRRAGGVLSITVEHEDGCPAITTVLLPAVRKWLAGG